jgi:hypothetical protein
VHAVEAVIIVGIAVLGWLGPPWLVAMYAERKGYSFWGFLIGGLLVSWLLTLVLAFVLKGRPMRLRTRG